MLSIRCSSRVKSRKKSRKDSKKSKKMCKQYRKIRPFTNQYNWEWIDNLTIAIYMFYIKEMNIRPAYVSKQMSNREKQVILLMIPSGEKLHHLAVLSFFFLIFSRMKKYVKIKTFLILGCLLKALRV